MPKLTNTSGHLIEVSGVSILPGATVDVSSDLISPAVELIRDGGGITIKGGVKPSVKAGVKAMMGDGNGGE